MPMPTISSATRVMASATAMNVSPLAPSESPGTGVTTKPAMPVKCSPTIAPTRMSAGTKRSFGAMRMRCTSAMAIPAATNSEVTT